ncbi:MAG: sigma-70 family RNA polymerase sigma factor [Pirellulales bacterium]
MDDHQLIASTLSGDHTAFDQLVLRYQDRLFASLVHVLGCTADAQDIAQDAFVQAFRKLSSFRGQSAFYSWLYRIALNVAASQRRRKRVTTSLDAQRERMGDEPVDRGGQPEQELERDEEVRLVRQALSELAEDHRTILVLREFDGHEYEQIAEILDVAVGTVRSRLHRARLQLKERLEHLMQR